MHWISQSLYEGLAMFWEVFWALVLGFTISAVLQTYISKEQMQRLAGRAGLREVALATLLGAASSSCSYAAVAAARTVFKKGAHLVPTLAFMLASTNLVFELGIVLWLLMGWQFVLAEVVGAFVMIAFMWLLVRLTLPQGLQEEARSHEETGGHDHEHSDHANGKLVQVAGAFVMDWSMLWKEMAIGFLIAGFLAVLVSNTTWQALFLTHSPANVGRMFENVIVGPVIAVISFVCSVGNIPLASILWSGGISFGGVIAFIYADLIVIPLIAIYKKYYGWRMALYITAVLFVSMVASGLAVDLLFSALHLVPQGVRPPSPVSHARFEWNYTTWLDIAGLCISVFLVSVTRRARRVDAHGHHHDAHGNAHHRLHTEE